MSEMPHSLFTEVLTRKRPQQATEELMHAFAALLRNYSCSLITDPVTESPSSIPLKTPQNCEAV